jgi:hypothetical protein
MQTQKKIVKAKDSMHKHDQNSNDDSISADEDEHQK